VNQGDGNLITVGGTFYTRGLGTAAPSELLYYLGGRCARLVTGVAIDDSTTTGSAELTIAADDRVVASATLTAAGGIHMVTADLTGATWLRLTARSPDTTGNVHADWVAPELVCGASTAPTIVTTTLFSFETGSDGWTIANIDSGGTMADRKSTRLNSSHAN